MRIYNPRKFPLNLPLDSGARLLVGPEEVSVSFMPSTRFLNLLVTTFSKNDLVLIVDGRSEYDLCSSVSAVPGYVVNSVEEALKRFDKGIPEKEANVKVEVKEVEVSPEATIEEPTVVVPPISSDPTPVSEVVVEGTTLVVQEPEEEVTSSSEEVSDETEPRRSRKNKK